MTNNLFGNLGNQVKQIRQSLLLSQEQLGRLTGLKQTAISRLEKGKGFSIKTLERICHSLGCEILISIKLTPETESLRQRIAADVRNPVQEIVTRRGKVVQKIGKESFLHDLKMESFEKLSESNNDRGSE